MEASDRLKSLVERADTNHVMAGPPDAGSDTFGDRQWGALLAETEDIVTVVGADRRQVWVSPALERVLGYRTVPDTFPAGFVHPEDAERIIEAFDRLIATGGSVTLEYRVRHADGRWRWVEGTGRNRLDDPRIRAVVAITRDITERRQVEDRSGFQARTKDRVVLADIIERSPHPAAIHSDGVVRWVNQAACELFELDPDWAAGRPLRDFIPAESEQVVEQRIALVLEAGAVQAGEVVVQTASGRRIVVETRATRTTWQEQAAVHLVLWDVTQRRAQADRLEWDATHDALTGLGNRALLDDRLRSALAGLRRDPGSVCVSFIDLDGFKAVNDTLGHLRGDEVLRIVAHRLAGVARPGDTVARYGGDEFVSVSVHPPDAAASIEDLTDRLRATLAAPILVGEQQAGVTAAIGRAITADPDADPTELIRAADNETYEAKRSATRVGRI